MSASRKASRHRDNHMPVRLESDSGGTGGRCPSGKVGYPNRKTARTAHRRAHPGAPLHAYPCELCHAYHLGTMPPQVLRGETGRGPSTSPARHGRQGLGWNR